MDLTCLIIFCQVNMETGKIHCRELHSQRILLNQHIELKTTEFVPIIHIPISTNVIYSVNKISEYSALLYLIV